MNIEARTSDFNADDGVSARRLAAAREPVFIFDGKAPVLVWANAAALAFVGHTSRSGAQLPHFDRAMPAIARLRSLAEQDLPANGLRTDLVFWTPRGSLALVCTCRRATFAFAPEALIVHAGAQLETETRTGAVAGSALDKTPAPVRHGKSDAGKTSKSKAKTAIGKARRAKSTGEPTVTTALEASGPAKRGACLAAEQGPDCGPVRPQTAMSAQTVSTQATHRQIVPGAEDEAGHTIALREIARQIQAATVNGSRIGSPPSVAPTRSPGQPATGVPTVSVQPVDGRAARNIAPGAPALAQSRHNIDFLSHIGHEIRTPLNSIMGFAEIMREERLGAVGNARYKTYAADIHDSAAHALSLINDLLDLSRAEAGGLQLDCVEVDVAATAAQAVASLQPIAEKSGVILSAPAGRPLPKLVGDARSLKQMLLNLLSNAIKHTDAGGAVWLTAASDDEGGLVIRVQDTGIGMRAEEITLALEPYAQVGPAERRAGGSGLGLPLTKAIAEANGGRLVLERIAGGGLAALLIFPADRVARG